MLVVTSHLTPLLADQANNTVTETKPVTTTAESKLGIGTDPSESQAAGRALSILILQERERWQNLSGLSDRQNLHILDQSVDSASLFGTTVATMQQRCEEKKKAVSH